MVKKQTTLQALRKMWLVTLAVTALLAACAPAQPTQNAQDVQAQIQNAVALTVAAQNAQTAQAQPAATEADTPTPTSTSTPESTLTPVIIPSFTSAPVSSGGGGGGGGYSGPAAWSCDPDIQKRPLDSNPPYAAGDHFEIKWTLLNNGTQTWPAGLDLTWFSVQASNPQITTPPQISTITGPIQLPVDIKPGQTWQIPTIEGIAPNKPGKYVLTWKLQGGWCFPYVLVNVKP